MWENGKVIETAGKNGEGTVPKSEQGFEQFIDGKLMSNVSVDIIIGLDYSKTSILKTYLL